MTDEELERMRGKSANIARKVFRRWRVPHTREACRDIADMAIAEALARFDVTRSNDLMGVVYFAILQGVRKYIRFELHQDRWEHYELDRQSPEQVDNDLHIRRSISRWATRTMWGQKHRQRRPKLIAILLNGGDGREISKEFKIKRSGAAKLKARAIDELRSELSR